MQAQTSAELPRYKSHKQVWALKIKAIAVEKACASAEAQIICGEPEHKHTPEAARGDVGMDHKYVPSSWDNGAFITPEEEAYAPFYVDQLYIDKHHPQVGGYYVVYADGYKSWSPAQAFEEGYTRTN